MSKITQDYFTQLKNKILHTKSSLIVWTEPITMVIFIYIGHADELSDVGKTSI